MRRENLAGNLKSGLVVKARNWVAVALLSVVTGIVVGVAAYLVTSQLAEHAGQSVTVSGVDCPTEDSCVADYSDGMWTVRKVQP